MFHQRSFASYAWLAVVTVTCLAIVNLDGQSPLPGTQPLQAMDDPSAQMVAGIGRYFDRQLDESIERRARLWHPDFSGQDTYELSLQPNRDRLARILGVVDARTEVPRMELVATTSR